MIPFNMRGFGPEPDIRRCSNRTRRHAIAAVSSPEENIGIPCEPPLIAERQPQPNTDGRKDGESGWAPDRARSAKLRSRLRESTWRHGPRGMRCRRTQGETQEAMPGAVDRGCCPATV